MITPPFATFELSDMSNLQDFSVSKILKNVDNIVVQNFLVQQSELQKKNYFQNIMLYLLINLPLEGKESSLCFFLILILAQ